LIRTTQSYFTGAFIVTFAGLVGACWLGWVFTGTLLGAGQFLLIGTILAALEISLSFDNAIVNANTLKNMQAKWQKRFLTWGILIAVFGMRIIFPLVVVSIAAHVGPLEAIQMAATEPQEYARLMDESHLPIAAFGGTFLMMVSLSFFVDCEKEIHWISAVERRLGICGRMRGFSVVLVLIIIAGFTFYLQNPEKTVFFTSAIAGLITFVLVEFLGGFLDNSTGTSGVAKAGLGGFLYLEVLDASFSFDGVIGAFALTKNLFLIAIGLGIGAMYVRSMTIMIVEKKTLAQFRYLEHGAFYSILALALIMFAQSIVEIPEMVTGLVGVSLIGLSFWSSIRFNRKNGLS